MDKENAPHKKEEDGIDIFIKRCREYPAFAFGGFMLALWLLARMGVPSFWLGVIVVGIMWTISSADRNLKEKEENKEEAKKERLHKEERQELEDAVTELASIGCAKLLVKIQKDVYYDDLPLKHIETLFKDKGAREMAFFYHEAKRIENGQRYGTNDDLWDEMKGQKFY